MPGCLVPGAPGVVCCGVGAGAWSASPLVRWSVGPLVRVGPLAGFRPVSALIWPVFGESPANAGAGGRRGSRCWLQLGAAGHLAGVWQAQVRARGCFMMGVRASTLPNSL